MYCFRGVGHCPQRGCTLREGVAYCLPFREGVAYSLPFREGVAYWRLQP